MESEFSALLGALQGFETCLVECHVHTAAAIGVLTADKTDPEINAYMASSAAGPPEWLPTLSLMQAVGQLSATYIDLPLGTWDVVCFRASPSEPPTITGRSTLHVSPA